MSSFIPTQYIYKVYQGTTYLGMLIGVNSDFNPSSQINTNFVQLNISTNFNLYTAALQNNHLSSEGSNRLTDESGNHLLSDQSAPEQTFGYANSRIQTGNLIKVIMISKYQPNGVQMFSGKITSINPNDGDNNNMAIVALSTGHDFVNYPVTGSECIDQAQTLTDGTSKVSDGGIIGGQPFDDVGQEFVTSTTVVNISAIALLVGVNPVQAFTGMSIQVDLYQSDKSTYIASTASVQINGNAFAEYKFNFSSPIRLTPNTKYFFVISSFNSQTNAVLIGQNNVQMYSEGGMYTQFGASFPTGSGWALQSGSLWFKTYTQGSLLNDSHFNEDPSNIALDLGSNYAAQGGKVIFSSGNVPLTNTLVSHQFALNTIDEGIKTVLTFGPPNYYYYVDANDNFNYKPYSSTPDFRLILGRHINSFNPTKVIDQIKNDVIFTGGKQANGQNIMVRVEDAASIAANGRWFDRISDNRVGDAETAYTICYNYVQRNKDPQWTADITINDGTIDFSLFWTGAMVSVRGYGDWRDQLMLPIIGIDFASGNMKLHLGALPPRPSKGYAEVQQRLTYIDTINNPVSVS